MNIASGYCEMITENLNFVSLRFQKRKERVRPNEYAKK